MNAVPTEEDVLIATESASEFDVATGKGAIDSFSVSINGRSVALPTAMSSIVGASLKIIAEGKTVLVAEQEEEISTQQAADLLGVSRPYLVKLLDAEELPSRKVGVRRRVRIGDVLDYSEQEKAARRKVLAKLAERDQKLGLGE